MRTNTHSSDEIETSHSDLIVQVPYHVNWEETVQRAVYGPANTLLLAWEAQGLAKLKHFFLEMATENAWSFL